MEVKQPTQERIKEFWEWCGVQPWRAYPTGYEYPDIDLNNLFKYAVPKLEESEYYISLETHKSYRHRGIVEYKAYTIYIPKAKTFAIIENDDPALALFWAIWEVIHDRPE